MDNFIVEFKNALSPEFCQHLIQKFEQSRDKKPGRTGAGVDKSKKDSTDFQVELEQIASGAYELYVAGDYKGDINVGAREIGVVGEADAFVALFIGAAAAPAPPDRTRLSPVRGRQN